MNFAAPGCPVRGTRERSPRSLKTGRRPKAAGNGSVAGNARKKVRKILDTTGRRRLFPKREKFRQGFWPPNFTI